MGEVSGERRVLVVLCLSQVVGWGVLFYALPVLAPDVSAETGWSQAGVIGAFSVAQLAMAVVGVVVGRVLDRAGPRVVMTWGSVLAVGSLVGVASATSLWWFFLAWTSVGVAMAAVLYQPAFAALTRWYGERRVFALTVLTLAGGLASTVFAPLTAALVGQVGWRRTYLVLAVVLGVLTIPAHFFGLRLPWTPHGGHEVRHPTSVARSRAFVVLVVAMTLGAFAVYAVVIAIVPLFAERGLSTSVAAWAIGLAGIGQVLARLGFGRLVDRTSARGRTIGILVGAATTTVLLGLVPGPAVALVVIAVLSGAVRGVFTLLQATAVSDRWGTRHYGRLSGLLQAPLTVATAVAPWAATAVADRVGGYPVVFALLGAAGAVAAVLAVWSVPATGGPVPVTGGVGRPGR